MLDALQVLEFMDDYLKRINQLEQQVEKLTRENQRLEEKLNVALDGNGLCLWEQHVPTGKLTIFNMEWGKMLGFQPQELEANVEIWKSRLHPDDYELAVGAFEDHLNGKVDTYQVIHRMIHNDGSTSWVSDRGRVVEYDQDGKPLRMMGTHIDITKEKRYELELSRLATLDPLTNLLNRKVLVEKCNEICRGLLDQHASLIFIDLDNFKTVNDHSGHKAGDSVLIKVAEWLNQYAPSESIIARFGGDEFVVLCVDHPREVISRYIDQLLTNVSEPMKVDNGSAQIGFSIGVCEFTTSNYTFEELYELADKAMYQVKHNGKNGVAYINADEN